MDAKERKTEKAAKKPASSQVTGVSLAVAPPLHLTWGEAKLILTPKFSDL